MVRNWSKHQVGDRNQQRKNTMWSSKKQPIEIYSHEEQKSRGQVM